MKKLFIICLIFLFACKNEQKCNNLVCPAVFSSVNVIFKNSSNEPIDVEDFQVYNTRTKKNINDHFLDSYHAKGTYVIISDVSKKEISFEGDRLIVSAKNPETNVVNETEFVISGGKCNCHVEKIAGPVEVVLQ